MLAYATREALRHHRAWKSQVANRHEEFLGIFVLGFLYVFIPSTPLWLAFCPWPYLTIPSALLACFLALGNIEHFRFIRARGMALPVAAGVVAALLPGVLPPFAENSDWLKHYALFNALVLGEWPVRVSIPEGDGLLRYSLSYYVMPALGAKILGVKALPLLVFVWTALGTGLVFSHVVASRGLSRGKVVAALIVFMAFSGADILGTLLTGYTRGPSFHLEWWAGFGELSASVTNLVWAPQHALPGWLVALMIYRFPERSVANAGVLLAAVALWSPFCAVGLLPLYAWAMVSVGPRVALTFSNCLLGPVLMVSAASYLLGGSGGIPFGFSWSHPLFTSAKWVVFVLLEFALVTFSLLFAQTNARSWVIVSTSFLLLLTLLSFGNNNDLLMRGSIPALGILAMACASVAVDPRLPLLRKLPLLVLLGVGAVTPVGELTRALIMPRIESPAQITLGDIVANNKAAIPQYLNMDSDELPEAGP
ncbi:hypothetical protein Q6A26_14745 [Xanthomonas euvesicatoria pv. eucalypti]|uniref:hypothetical protein n=1 Tax=Xanthomonas euvesicatoria TaxID=456327 RepID=UPI0026E20D4C|nr:hypothetical protein [Xanthomonas euvesicatoria]MDO7933390.1 hypothetical protein [Xanthomonas euvesicatoria pv. eucalypti]MDO7937621.1 hypothetical protein [Xanthomonas euvesicatoria pv. eucalypti]MDO7942006.1 hypothetical protein [Xanthomonas euvesicatoria pv. eucalypti]MDO7946159.1 hypothetical protein [Xanthomonas euvesicatoria pv. eucalypti]MDO7948301.1 hypothetical protein [Xanthomonas euvesicatoria pv. eucalypti]